MKETAQDAEDLASPKLDRFVVAMDRHIARERKSGKIKAFSGNLEADVAD